LKNRRDLREQITACLRESNFPALVELAGRETGVPTQLLRFLYDPNDVLQWRALEGLGHVAGAHPGQVQKVIGRLLWLLNEDSGSFGWGAAAALGEIGRHQLSLVQEIIPMFYGFLEEEFSRGPMLWGLGRLGEVHPQLLEETLPLIEAALGDADPQVRGWAAWCLGQARVRRAAPAFKALLGDDSPIKLYDGWELRQTTVARVAKAALDSLEAAK
jgi:HEAT repeat protein